METFPRRKVTETYRYVNAEGVLLFEKLRFEPKSFAVRSPDGNGGWNHSLNGVPRVLYHLPEVIQSRYVIITEGEKDVDSVRALDLRINGEKVAATCNYDGAGKWKDEYNTFFAGKRVVVIPDNDEPGRQHAQLVALSVAAYAEAVKIVTLRDLPEKGDVTDYLESHTRDDLVREIKDAPPYLRKEPKPAAAQVSEDDWPEPMSEAAFHGLAGDFVRLVLPESEADPHALLVAFLVIFGCMVGRGSFFQVESTRHGVNLFTVIVGTTSSGRKGTATDRAVEILRIVDPVFIRARKVSGLSSGEGLIHAVRDAREEEVQIKEKTGPPRTERQIVDPGEPDKRLLVVEGEFARVLQQASRNGNILSSTLRDGWDGKPLQSLARSNQDSCQEPHPSIIGNITPEELQIQLSTNDKANGFANRFLWCCSRRSKLLPHGGNALDPTKTQALVSGLQDALATAKSIGQITLDAQAYKAWDSAYRVLSVDHGGLFGSMTARAAPLVLRLATLYALLDSSGLIRTEHLRAAQEMWRYCEDSVRYLFGDALGDDTGDAIRRMLRNAPEGMTQTEINRAFGSHKPAAELNRALELLSSRGFVKSQTEETGGAPVTRWISCA